MSTVKPQGIKGLLSEYRQLDITVLDSIRAELLESVSWPTIRVTGPLPVKTNDTLTVAVDNLTVPVLDLYHGRVESRDVRRSRLPLVVRFSGPHAPVAVATSRGRDETTVISCEVPPDARSGPAELLVPVVENYGSPVAVRRLATALGLDSTPMTRPGFLTDVGPQLSCPVLPLTEEEIRWKLLLAAEVPHHVLYREQYLAMISIGCDQCVVGCPHGAITLDEFGVCTVDPDICVGQRYSIGDRTHLEQTPDGRDVYAKTEESACWDCFVGNEPYSQKCPRSVLRRTLHHNGVCCASCDERSRVVGLTLQEVCTFGAISTASGSFQVDKDQCTGCMSCYAGIRCSNNVDAGRPLCCMSGCPAPTDANFTIRMVAYADHADG